MRGLLVATVIALQVMACSGRVDTQGYVPEEELINEIKVGVHGPREVAEILGTPPSSRAFPVDKSMTWYYIQRRIKRKTFFDEDVLEQRVLAVEFDEAGVVRELHSYDLADGRSIEPVERITPTRGKRLGFLEQLFGNLGRYGGLPGGAPAP